MFTSRTRGYGQTHQPHQKQQEHAAVVCPETAGGTWQIVGVPASSNRMIPAQTATTAPTISQ